MASAFQTVVQPAKPQQLGETQQAAPPPPFWREFIRVQSDKILLVCLIVYLHSVGAPENLQAAAIGGLIVLIQGQRFKIG